MMGKKWMAIAALGAVLVTGGQAAAQGFGFSTPFKIVEGAVEIEGSDVAADGDVALVMWEENEDDMGGNDWDVFYSRTTDAGATWSAPVNLTNYPDGADVEDNLRVDVVTSGGRWVVVTTDTSVNGGDIFAYISDDVASSPSAAAISWTGPITVHNDGAADDEDADVQLATDGAGTWMVVWEKVYDLPPTVTQDESDAYIAVSTDDGMTWSSEVLVSAVAGDDVAPTGTEDGDVGIAYTDGTWVICWKHGGSNGQDEDPFVAFSTDNGTTWSASIPVAPWNGTDAADDDNVAINADTATDTFIMTWHSEVPDLGIGSDKDIIVATASSSDPSTWTVAALNEDAASDSGDDENALIGTDAFGNIFVTWGSDEDGMTNYEIDAAMSTDGGVTWTYDVSIATDIGDDDDIEGGTNASLAGTFYTTYNGNGEEDVTVSVRNIGGGTGGSGEIVANPTIVEDGGLLTLTAPAGTAYQWFRNGVPMTDTARITGTNGQTLTFTPALEQDTAAYTVEYDDGTKVVVTSAAYSLIVYPAGALPSATAATIALLAFVMAVALVRVARRQRIS